MKEKLVENWLIKASERAYQGPLCAVLSYEGYSVVHSTRHCSMEMGKDIIATDENGELVCFQLKAHKGKRLTLSEWRDDLQQQIYPLVMGKVIHPAAKKAVHKSIIVITGYLDEEVSNEIQQFNQGQVDAGYSNRKIEVWTLGDLLTKFSKHLHKLGPVEPEDIKVWLELFLDGGRGLPDLVNFHVLFDSVLSKAEIDSVAKAKAFVSYNIVVAGSIANQYASEDNHVAEIQVWMATYMQTLYVQEKHGVSSKDSEVDRAIILDVMRSLLAKLVAEVKSRGRFSEFDEMHELFEQHYAPLTGAMIALDLVIGKGPVPYSNVEIQERLDLLEKVLEKSKLIGEVSIVYLFLIDLVLLKFGRVNPALQNLFAMLSTLLHANSEGEIKLPSPNYDIQTVLLWVFGEDLDSTIVDDCFEKSSFTLRSLVMFLTAMNARRMIEGTWREISHFKCNEFIPDNPLEMMLRHSSKGVNWTYLSKTPQSWNELRAEAINLSKGNGLPLPLRGNLLDIFLLILSQPYRLTAEVACHMHVIMGLPQAAGKSGAAASDPKKN